MKINNIFHVIFFIFSFFTNILFAQWLPDVRLTYNYAGSLLSYNNAKCIASNGIIVHVVWFDRRDGTSQIYYKRTTNDGSDWSSDIRLTYNPGSYFNPCIAISGSNVYVVYNDSAQADIYFLYSSNGGINWGPETHLILNIGSAGNPSVSVSGSGVHIVWYDIRDGNFEIYYKYSPNNGINWNSDLRLTNNPSYSEYPSISVQGQIVHVAWYDHRDGDEEIYYKRSLNGGIGWEADKRLTNNLGYSWLPSISASDSLVHVVWMDSRDAVINIYDKYSSDAGFSWSADTRISNGPPIQEVPSVYVWNSNVHVVWQIYGGNRVNYIRSINGGISWDPVTILTNNSSQSYKPSITVSGTYVHVVWEDNRDSNYEIYYKRNPLGNPVGFENNNHDLPNQFSLYQNYPNPFNPKTIISFQLAVNSFTQIVIYDVLGNKVETLVSEQLKPGTYEVTWDVSNYASGIYYYRLSAGDPSLRSGEGYSETRKMILVK